MTTISKTIGRDLPNGDYIEITAELRDGSDGLSPGFSVVGSLWEKTRQSARARKRLGRDSDTGGQITEEIRRAAPEVEPIMAVHLADPDGTPMHAVSNGWYFYTGKAAAYERAQYSEEYAARFGTDHERAARALHIPATDLPEGLDEEGFKAFAESLRARWAEQAAAARAALDALVDGDGVE